MLRVEDCKPGVLVECVHAEPWPELTNGAIYTIRNLVPPWVGKPPRFPAIWLEEIRLTSDGSDLPDCYNIERFRLLPDERLAIFRAMLQSVQVDA